MVDNASTGLRNLNTQITLLGGAVDKTLKPVLDVATKQMRLLAAETRETNKAVNEMRKDLEHFGTSLVKIGQEVGLIGQIGAIGGLIGIIGGINAALTTFADKMLELREASTSAGLVPDQFKNISRQLEMMGYTSQQADAQVIKFFRNLNELTRTGTPEFERMRQLTAATDRNAVFQFAKNLQAMVNRGEGERAIQEAAAEVQRIFNRELAKPGGTRAEATRQAEAAATVFGLDPERVRGITQFEPFGGSQEWQKRIDLGNKFKEQMVLSDRAFKDMIYGMQEKMLPTMIELNRWAGEFGKTWGEGIGKEIKQSIEDVKTIVRDITGLWNFLKADRQDVERRLNQRRDEQRNWLPDWLRNMFSVTPAYGATMPGGPGTAYPGTGGGPMGNLPGLPPQQALPRVGPTGPPSTPQQTPPYTPPGPAPSAPAPVPYSPAPPGPGGLPGAPRTGPQNPPPAGPGPGSGPGAGQTPAPRAPGNWLPGPGGIGQPPPSDRFTPYAPGGAPQQVPPGPSVPQVPFRPGRGDLWRRPGGPFDAGPGPGVGPGAGDTPAPGSKGDLQRPGIDFGGRFGGEPGYPGLVPGDTFDERFRGAPIPGPRASDVGPPSTAPSAALPPPGQPGAWPRTLPTAPGGRPIGTAEPSPGFGLPSVDKDYIPKVLGQPATPSATPSAGGGAPSRLGDLNIQDISGQSARAGRAGELRQPQAIITHFTGGTTLGSAVNTLNQRGLGYNYIVDKDGTIYQFTPTGKTGAHMRSGWGETGQGLSNANTIGVSAVATGERDMTPAQIESMKNLTAALGTEHGISPKNVFGHGEVNPGHRSVGEGSTIYNWARGLDGWPAGGGGVPPAAAGRQGATGGGGWPTRAPMTPWPGTGGGGGQEQTAKGSWYSQFQGKHSWVDTGDRPGSNALGVPDSQQGIALPSRSTLGKWFDVTGPDGKTHRLQQTDIGPAKWTGKGIDISAAAAERMGYSPKNFPTGANFSWRPAGEAAAGKPVPFLSGKDTSVTEGDWRASVGALDRGVLDAGMAREAGMVEGKGDLNVTVTDKRGVGATAGTSDLYQPKPVERMTQHEPAKEGPSKPESTPDPIDLPEVEVKGGDRGEGEE